MLFLLVSVSPSYDPILLWFVLASCRPSGRPAVSGAYTLKVEKLSFDARTLSHSLAVPETEPPASGPPSLRLWAYTGQSLVRARLDVLVLPLII